MATITSVDEFFGLPASNWIEYRYGDVQRLICTVRLDAENPDQSTPLKVSGALDPTARFIEIFFTEVVLNVTTTPARQSTSLTGADEPATIAISSAREATTEDMDLDDQGDPYPLIGKVDSVTILDQEVAATRGKFELITPTSRQKRPLISSSTLPGLVVWMTSIQSENKKSNVLYGSFYRPGPQGE